MAASTIKSRDYLTLHVGGKVKLAYVRRNQEILLVSSPGSRWPSSLLRNRRARISLDGMEINGTPFLITDESEKKSILDLFSAKYDHESVEKWFGRSSRFIVIRTDVSSPVYDYEENYNLWITEEFNSIAEHYDDHIFGNFINSYLRSRSIETMMKIFPASSDLLEIGCGSGTETLTLLKSGFRVTAIDISEKMIRIVNQKAEREGVKGNLKSYRLSFSEVDKVPDASGIASFDGIYSTYGAFNCDPHIDRLPGKLHRLLKPGGILFLGVYNKLCASEILLHAFGMKIGRIFERFRNPVPEGNSRFCVDVFSYSPMYVKRLFSQYFNVVSIEAVPLIIPPSNYVHFMEKLPGNSVLESLDRRLSKLPFLNVLGDHFLIVLKRKG